MNIGKFYIAGGTTNRSFYWLPRQLTTDRYGAIYRWGYWNFGFVGK